MRLIGKKKDLTLEKGSQTNILRSTNHSLNFIARAIGVNKPTLSRTMSGINECGDYSSTA